MADTRIAIGSGCGNVPGPTGPEGPAGPAGPGLFGTLGICWSPGNPLGDHDNVYTTWAGAFAALDALRDNPQVWLVVDDRYGATIIPPGTWDLGSPYIITDVSKDGIPVDLYLADGASILAASIGNIVSFQTSNMRVISNRVGPIPPFKGVNAIAMGNRTRFCNTLPGVLPMFEHSGNPGDTNFIALSGSNSFGGVGDGAALPSPLIDVKGQAWLLGGGAGFVGDNAFTDSVGGGIILMRLINDGFTGGSYPGQTYAFPAFEAAGGTYSWLVQHRDRHFVTGPSAGPTITAVYNNLVLANTAANAIAVNLPRARPAKGERVTIVDSGNNAATNNITATGTGGDVVQNPVINTNGGHGTWVCDGLSPTATWWRIA